MLNRLIAKETKLAVVGLGYVGLPIALAFAQRLSVIGFDIKRGRVEALAHGEDTNGEMAAEAFADADIHFTHCAEELAQATCFIIAVPTPIDRHNKPDLAPLLQATRTVGKVLKRGDYICYESTVYPGCTEEDCLPILEALSGLKMGVDFKVGYSPERINPSDKVHLLTNTTKIVSGCDSEALHFFAELYALILGENIYQAPSIRVAEAAKIMENTQRDVNIALMNEFAKIFEKLGIDTREVIDAAATKWNFHRYLPGLVGGHCIGVDPYYLIQRSVQHGYTPHLISEACRLNDSMGLYVAQRLINLFAHKGGAIKGARVLLMGITFKENCPDIRNSKVVDIYRALIPHTERITVIDPIADRDEVQRVYGIEILAERPEGERYDAIVKAVAHSAFASLGSLRDWLIDPNQGVIFDVKSTLPREESDARL